MVHASATVTATAPSAISGAKRRESTRVSRSSGGGRTVVRLPCLTSVRRSRTPWKAIMCWIDESALLKPGCERRGRIWMLHEKRAHNV